MLTPNFRLFHNVVQLLYWDEYCLFSSVNSLYMDVFSPSHTVVKYFFFLAFVLKYLATIQIRGTLSLSSATFQNKILYSHS